jgi:tetratricopeptide (TPR) repeat protein
MLGVILVYSPVWWAGYVWDDHSHLTANPCIVGPLGLKEIWTTQRASICPLVFTTFWAEHKLWNLTPLPYHLVNIFFHAACAIFLWRLLRCLQVPGAWLGAALWALHPVQVESVAWITEMKNTESGVFFLLAGLFFVKYLKTVSTKKRVEWNWNYVLTLVFAALAMTSKSSTVILPLVLCLGAWWVEGRWQWRTLIRLAPIFVMSAVVGTFTLWLGTLEPAAAHAQLARSWPERIATVGDAIWFYLAKLIWPHPLMVIYPRWKIDAREWYSYLPFLAAIVILVALWLKRETSTRPYFFALAYFLAVLLPFLGFIDQAFWRFSFVEDHLQYLASMGPLALVAAGLARLSDFIIPRRLRLQSVLATGVLLFFGALSWQRTWAYESNETLWTDELAKNSDCWLAHNNIGNVLFEQGKLDDAVFHFRKALEIKPDYAECYYNLGNVLVQKGQIEDAILQFRRASELKPDYADPKNNLGNIFFQKGQFDEAIVSYQSASDIDPANFKILVNLARALDRKGQFARAIAEYEKAIEIDPNIAEVRFYLGNALSRVGQTDEAIDQYQEALKIAPNYAEAHNNLGIAYGEKGNLGAAITQFQEALRLKPNFSEATSNLTKAQTMARQKTDLK